MYDILIPVAEKDFVKIKYVWESIINCLSDFDNIYCVSDVKMPLSLRLPGVEYYTDEDVINFDARLTGTMQGHEGWYRQQYVKLFQKITSDDYLEVDADVFFNKKIDIIENGKPTFLFGRDQNHAPYFNLMKKLFDIDRTYPYSFINETMYFKRSIIDHFLESSGLNNKSFLELIINEVNNVGEMSGFSEYEFYGNYVTKNFPDYYNYKHLNTRLGGKYGHWSEEEVRQYVNYFKSSDFELISMHTWIQ